MTLDLDDLITGWECPPGELRARAVGGRDGTKLLQLRVDLGVLQMFLTGRPDGQHYRGQPTVRDYVARRLQARSVPTRDDWRALERELLQFNYRRMAFSAAAERALEDGREPRARRFMRGALADIRTCLAILKLLGRCNRRDQELYPSMRPTLVFDEARLRAQLRVVEGRYEEAVEEAESGADRLERLLDGLGYEPEQRDADAGLRYLRTMERQLRRSYGIAHTLREQLDDAVEREDFEEAARLRDELAERTRRRPGRRKS